MNLKIQAMLGIVVFLALAWLLGESRRQVKILPVLGGLLAQALLALVILRITWVQHFFLFLSHGINALKVATAAGTNFVFGFVGGAAAPFEPVAGVSTFVFAFQALPSVIVVSALAMLLFHWNILPIVVRGFSWLLSRSLRIGGALGLCAAAKVFLGQSEAPLLIRPYIGKLTRSELFTVMTLGMSTTSAAIMIVYATILENTVSNPISHILTASIISVPAAVGISRLMVPHQGPDTEGALVAPYSFSGAMDAVAHGATDGMKLFLNIIAMLLAVLALVSLANSILGNVSWAGAPASMERLFGLALAPMAWLMGIPWEEAAAAGQLIGTKIVLNEVMAFIDLSRTAHELSQHTRLIMTYALCGFANFSSIGIQIGGIGTLVPERRQEIIELGFRSLIAGMLSTSMSGTIVGLLTD